MSKKIAVEKDMVYQSEELLCRLRIEKYQLSLFWDDFSSNLGADPEDMNVYCAMRSMDDAISFFDTLIHDFNVYFSALREGSSCEI